MMVKTTKLTDRTTSMSTDHLPKYQQRHMRQVRLTFEAWCHSILIGVATDLATSEIAQIVTCPNNPVSIPEASVNLPW